MDIVKYPDTVMLIQHSFSTILLDAIQFYPQDMKKQQAESHGLLFGNIKNDVFECDYVFPVGNVSSRKPDEILPNQRVDKAIQNAKQLLFTSSLLGTYHSHPNKVSFEGWSEPSNGDISYVKNKKTNIELIVSITKNAVFENSLFIEYGKTEKTEFYHIGKLGVHEFPKKKGLEGETTYIKGKFKKYTFELRAFKYENKCLKSVDLISSEAEMLMELIKSKLVIEDLSPEMSYALRKIEYDFRAMNTQNEKEKDKAKQNMQYHIKKIVDRLKKR